MNSTASPRPSVALGQATKFIRLLENKGVTPRDIQRAIDDPAILRKVVEAFGLEVGFAPRLDLSSNLSQTGVDRLIKALVVGYAKSDRANVARASKRVSVVDLEDMSPVDIQRLILDLTKLQQHLVNLTFGLMDGVALSDDEVAQRLEISLARVRSQRGVALRVMRTEQHRIINERIKPIRDEMRKVRTFNPDGENWVTPESPIEMLIWLDPLGYRALKRADINLVADLTRLSVEDRRGIYGLSQWSFDRIERSLALQLKG